MKHLNEFLNKARQTGVLEVTPVRIGGATPVIDLFTQKVVNVLRRAAPDAKITGNKPIGLAQKEPTTALARQTAKIAQAAAKTPPLFAWSRMVKNAMPDDAITKSIHKDKVRPDHLLHEFAQRHAAAFTEFEVCMTAAPGFGRGIAAGMSTHMGKAMNLDPLVANEAGFSRCVDSVYMSSFADAYALLTLANEAGSKVAMETADLVLHHRESSGDFAHYSQSPQSSDTEGAIKMVKAELEMGAVYGKLGRDNLVGHAMGIAAENVGKWMSKHGARDDVAESIADIISSVGSGYRAASIKLREAAQLQAVQNNPGDRAIPDEVNASPMRHRMARS